MRSGEDDGKAGHPGATPSPAGDRTRWEQGPGVPAQHRLWPLHRPGRKPTSHADVKSRDVPVITPSEQPLGTGPRGATLPPDLVLCRFLRRCLCASPAGLRRPGTSRPLVRCQKGQCVRAPREWNAKVGCFRLFSHSSPRTALLLGQGDLEMRGDLRTSV